MTLRLNQILVGFVTIAAIGLMGPAGCGDPYIEPLPPRDRFHWPIGLEVHPEGRFLYVVNSNFDTRYREDVGGTVSVVDLERLEILPGNGPYIPSFAGFIELNRTATKAYVTVRSENQVLALDVAADGSLIGCEVGDALSADVQSCSISRVPDRAGGAEIPSDPFGLDVLTLPSLEIEIVEAVDGEYRISLDTFGLRQNFVVTAGPGDSTSDIAAELIGLIEATDEYILDVDSTRFTVRRVDGIPFTFDVSFPSFEGDDGEEPAATAFDAGFDLIGVSHLRGTNVSAITVPSGDISSASLGFAELISGSNDVAVRPGTQDFYVAGRLSREVAIFRPFLNDAGQVEAIIDRGAINLNHLTNVVDARALEFEPDGETLYVATRNPDALHIIDLGPRDPQTGTGVLGRVVDSIPLEREPSDVVRHVRSDGKVLLYIPCFRADLIQVVDPALGAIVDEIQLGASPYAFDFDRGDRCVNPDLPCRGYVTLFDDLARAGGSCNEERDETCGSVGVIDLDPTSNRYHQLIAKID